MNKLFILISSFFVFGAEAQQIFKSGGSTHSTFLIGNPNYAKKTQLLYSPSDLSNERSGPITRIYFKYGNNSGFPTQTLNYFKVKLGQTTDLIFGSNNTFYSDLKTVKSAASYSIAGGNAGTWLPIDLDSTFQYDSTKTLIVQVSFGSNTNGNFGTYGTPNTPVKKLMAVDTSATTGDGTSSTWQDFAFDLVVTGNQIQLISEKGMQIFPNPVGNELFLKANTDMGVQATSVTIFNSLGKWAGEFQFSGADPIDVSRLPKGVYFLEWTNGLMKFRKSFVKD